MKWLVALALTILIGTAVTTTAVDAVRAAAERVHCPNAASNAAIGPFVSHAPRPYSRPPRPVNLNAGTVIPRTPTVSRCGANTIVARAGRVGSNTPTTVGRPGASNCTDTSAPSPRNRSATPAAIAASPGTVPPGSASGCTLGSATSSRRIVRALRREVAMGKTLACDARSGKT